MIVDNSATFTHNGYNQLVQHVIGGSAATGTAGSGRIAARP